MAGLATRRSQVRIAIGGRYLDEVRTPLARSDVPGCASFLSFPAHRHAARVEAGQVLVSAQAQTVVKLFADGVLPPIGGRAVTLTVGRRQLGPCLLDAVEAGGASRLETTVVLHFHRAIEGGP
jgi:hypothetical protein